MKELMTGNEAVARGAYEGGCILGTAYPGTPSTEILEALSQYGEVRSRWSVNEKTAMEVAAGAAIAGARVLVTMKHVGLNVAADPLFSLAYLGVEAGLVVVSADDPGCHSSQNEQDNRLYGPHAKVPIIEPSDSQECKDFAAAAFALSERFDCPVILRLSTRVCHTKGLVETSGRTEAPPRPYQKKAEKYVNSPSRALARHWVVEEKLRAMSDYADSSPLNRIEGGRAKIGVVCSGISYQHAREAFGQAAGPAADGSPGEVAYLKIGLSYPLPTKLIRDFAKRVETLYVVEENEPYLENSIKALGIACVGKDRLPICGELNPDLIRKAFGLKAAEKNYQFTENPPSRPPTLCAGCPHRNVFYALKSFKGAFIAGDIGCYSLGGNSPLDATDCIFCMGAGVTAAIGVQEAFVASVKAGAMAKAPKVFGVVGDSTFFHSGITGLVEASYKGSRVAIVILDNRTTAMTGHQGNPGTGTNLGPETSPPLSIEAFVLASGVPKERLRVVDPYDGASLMGALREAAESEELFVVIARRPCALLKEEVAKRAGYYYTVDQGACRGCRACLGPGCPALAMDGKARIDARACAACGLCASLCKFGAISLKGAQGEKTA